MAESVCEALKWRLMELAGGVVDGDAVVAASGYPDVLEHIRGCSGCKEEFDRQVLLFLDQELGLIPEAEPPRKPDLDAFLPPLAKDLFEPNE